MMSQGEAHASTRLYPRSLPRHRQQGLIYGPGDECAVTSIQQYLQRQRPLSRGHEFLWAHVDDVARGHLLAWRGPRLAKPIHLRPGHS